MTVNMYFALLLLISCLTIARTDNLGAKISDSNNKFSNKLYNILAKKDGNILFSPISVHAVLSLAYQGASGDTAKSFETALDIIGANSTAVGYKTVMTDINNVKNITLNIANKIYVNDKYQLKKTFNDTAADYFLAEAENVNFAEKTETAGKINNWVEDKTNHKIKNLVSPDALSSLTRLVLVNAVYFKGDWLQKFDSNRTTKEKFYISEYSSVECDMMHINEQFDYVENAELDAKILKLPYKNQLVSLVIILPNKKTGIKNLEEKLVGKDLSTLTKKLDEVSVSLSLPKFKIEATIDLNEPLKELNLSKIFSDAEFPNLIESTEPLSVSQVLQTAFIEVNEEGAEAAAATFGIIDIRNDDENPHVYFNVNRPFIFMLQISNTILFYGRIVEL